jgi:hypothetical protein
MTRGIQLADERVAPRGVASSPVAAAETACNYWKVVGHGIQVVIGGLAGDVDICGTVKGNGEAGIVGTASQVSGIAQRPATRCQFRYEHI